MIVITVLNGLSHLVLRKQNVEIGNLDVLYANKKIQGCKYEYNITVINIFKRITHKLNVNRYIKSDNSIIRNRM